MVRDSPGASRLLILEARATIRECQLFVETYTYLPRTPCKMKDLLRLNMFIYSRAYHL